MKSRLMLLAVILAMAFIVSNAGAQYNRKVTFNFVDLQPYMTAGTQSFGTAINDLGAIVATQEYDFGEAGVCVFDGISTSVRLPSAYYASSINKRGQIAGDMYDPKGGGWILGAKWDSAFDVPDVVNNTPFGINHMGSIAGGYGEPRFTHANPRVGTRTLDMGLYQYAVSFGLNDYNVCVGYVASPGITPATWNGKNGHLTVLKMPNGLSGVGLAINNGGTILTNAFNTSDRSIPTFGALRSKEGKWTFLQIPGWYVNPSAINNYNSVAGSVVTGNNGTQLPFVWSNQFGFKLLPLPTNARYGGAECINNRGVIVGWWVDQNWRYHAARWSPTR